MPNFQKPDTPTAMSKRCNELYEMLKTRSTFTKQEIAGHFKVSVRSAREMVSTIAKRRPIIATSNKRGYRLASQSGDYLDAKHQWAEIDSRIAELEARKLPLIRFCEKVEKTQDSI